MTRPRKSAPASALMEAIQQFWRGLDAVGEASEVLKARYPDRPPPRKRKPKVESKD